MTLAAITMTAPEAASPVQMYRATYSPDDNKLRLYAVSRLDPETYKKVHDAGFRWAPKQALFVAPAWTPGREDVLLSLAGEIEDEDSTLAERQEARAERFTGYSGKRASESAQALDEVERLAAMIPPGQPILVGHHSERRARRDAQRIENGMKRAVMLFERAEYWEERARSALLHAKYKERPDVRWRRIKKIEADLRKAEKTIAQSQKYLTMWRAESLDLNMAKLISSHDHISACFPLDTYPRPAEKSQYEGSRSLWSALDDDIITTEQAREIAIRCHERQIQRQQRWVICARARRSTSKVSFAPVAGRITVSPVTSPKFLLRPRAPCRCWDVPQVLRLSRKRGNSSAVSISRNHRRRPVRKKEAQKRKAVDVRPRSRSRSRNRRRVTITGFQMISRSERLTVTTAPSCAGHHRRYEDERIFQNTSGTA